MSWILNPDTFNLDPPKLKARSRAEREPSCAFICLVVLPISRLCLPLHKRAQLMWSRMRAQAVGPRFARYEGGEHRYHRFFSLYPAKNFGCASHGGLVTTDYEKLADRLRILHTHGSGQATALN